MAAPGRDDGGVYWVADFASSPRPLAAPSPAENGLSYFKTIDQYARNFRRPPPITADQIIANQIVANQIMANQIIAMPPFTCSVWPVT
jgi:hypothetical protein